MRLLNVIFVLLVLVAFAALGNLYLTNHELLNRELIVFDHHMKIWWAILLVFALGFVLNLLYAGVMEIYRALKGLNDSAASRLGQRISVRLEEARRLLAHGLAREAKPVLAGILEQQGGHPEAQVMLAEAHLKLGEPEEAIKLLQNLTQHEPFRVEARYLLADALQAGRNREGSAQVLRQLSTDHPKKALRALRRLRALQVDAQQWEEALETHKKLLQAFPQEITAAERGQGVAFHHQIGLQKVEIDQFKEASLIFQQIIKEDSSFVPAYLSLGRCMILQDQEQQGLEIWLEGFRATGEGTFLQEVEDYFIQLGKPEEGIGLLRRIAATSKHGTLAKFFLGKMLYRLEILDEALELFQEVRAQVVYAPILFFFMAKIHQRRGRLDDALSEYRQLLRNLGVLKLRFECSVCGHKTQDYEDRCGSCGSWNSVHFLFKENELPEGPLRGDQELLLD